MIITLPDCFAFAKIDTFQLLRAGNTLRSKYNAKRQTIVFPFAIWIVEGSLIEYSGENAAKIRSFLVQLDGQKNTFRLPVPGHTAPTSGYTGDVATSAAVAANATTLSFKGAQASKRVLNDGDFFTIGDELKIAVGDVNSNSTGNGTLAFRPALRNALTVDAQVKIQNPTVLLQARDDDIASWGIAVPVRQQSSLAFIEAVE